MAKSIQNPSRRGVFYRSEFDLSARHGKYMGNTIPEYSLDSQGHVIKSGETNIDELVMSSFDTRLEAVLEKFGFVPSLEDPVHVQDTSLEPLDIVTEEDQLISMQPALERASELREQFDMPNSDMQEVYSKLADYASKMKISLSQALEDLNGKEKKTEPQSE